MAAWNGQVFHGRLLGAGLTAGAIDEVLPQRKKTMAERRADRDADMARKVAAINGVMRTRKAEADGR